MDMDGVHVHVDWLGQSYGKSYLTNSCDVKKSVIVVTKHQSFVKPAFLLRVGFGC